MMISKTTLVGGVTFLLVVTTFVLLGRAMISLSKATARAAILNAALPSSPKMPPCNGQFKAGIDAIAKNLANAQTQAFKRSRVDLQTGNPVLDMSQGPLENTGAPLDLAIEGPGFFQVATKHGTAYTRNGALFLDNNGDLTIGLAAISALLPKVNVPNGAQKITVAPDGTVSFTRKGFHARITAGRIRLFRFVNPTALAVSSGLFFPTSGSGPAVEITQKSSNFGLLRQGFLEASNVEPDTEFADLMKLQPTLADVR